MFFCYFPSENLVFSPTAFRNPMFLLTSSENFVNGGVCTENGISLPPTAKSFLLNLFGPCDLNSRTAYLPAEESALLITTTFEPRTSCLLRSVIDSLSSWGAEGDAASNRQNVLRHFEHVNDSSWSSSRTPSLQRGHFILCVWGNLFPSTSKGTHLSYVRELCFNKGGSEWVPGSNALMISFPGEGKWGIP